MSFADEIRDAPEQGWVFLNSSLNADVPTETG
jgi:hypothetical protein